MAESQQVAEQALKKLADQLTCAVCLDNYTDPKLLQCFHVFCKKCLEPLVVRDQRGLSLRCPNCRRSTLLPPNSVSGLQAAFHIEHLFEIRDALEKVKAPQKPQCEKCKTGDATSFCRTCGKFICATCTQIHQTWEELSSHEVVGTDQVIVDVTQLIPPKKKEMHCPKHKGKELEIYCETCKELICLHCTVSLHQREKGHEYDLVSDTFPKHKDELVSCLKPVEEQLSAVTKGITSLDTRCSQITDQRAAVEADIHKTIRQLHEALEVRKTELIGQLDHMTQQKLKTLAAQRDQFELIQTQLSSCHDFVNESLRTGSQAEILEMKKPVVKQIKEITADFKPETLVPEEQADMKFVASSELVRTCQQFGQVYAHPVCPEKCYATDKGLEVATVGEQTTVTLHAIDDKGQECEKPLANVSCELVSRVDSTTVKCSVKKKESNKYELSYQPARKGQHQLHVRVEGRHIRGSPFTVTIEKILTTPTIVKNLTTPTKIIGDLKGPWGVTVNQRGQIIVAESGGDCISIFSPNGEKVKTFGSRGSAHGQFSCPRDVTVDRDGNILVADGGNYRIQKFTADGQFLKSVGKAGKQHLEFNFPIGIAIHPQHNKVYVCEYGNCRIQILNKDLTFSSSFGSPGSDNGQFKSPWNVACDSAGNVYVADFGNHRIQVFMADGQFLRSFGKKGGGDGELKFPSSVCIDSDDVVYVTDRDNHRVSLFTCQGQFLKSFGTKRTEPGQFANPYGIAVDRDGLVYICDHSNNRLQIF